MSMFEDMLRYINILNQEFNKQVEFNKALQAENNTLKSKSDKKD